MNIRRHHGRFVLGSLAVTATLIASLLLLLVPAASAQAAGFEANLTFDNVGGCNFAPDASVDVTVKDAPGGTVLSTDTAPTDGAGCFTSQSDSGLEPGMYVSVDDGTTLKELTLVPLTIDVFDIDANTVAGTTAPNTAFFVDAETSPGNFEGLNSTSDGAGDWVVDFDDIGVDIEWFTHVGAAVPDGDGDQTAADRTPPTFEGNLGFENVNGCNFAPDASVDVTIKDAPGGAVLFTDSPATDGNGCFDTGYEVDLVPGMYISVTDGFGTKELTLVTLSIDDIDPAANTVSGTAPPNTTFNVDAFTDDWHGLDATSDGTGAWTVDFDDISVDITPTTHVGANIVDEDGDGTAVDRVLFGGAIEGFLSTNWVSGGGYVPDTTVTVEVYDSPGGTLLVSGTEVVHESGDFFFALESIESPCVDLVPGMHVVVTDDTTGVVKEVTLVDFTWDVLDPDTDTAAGTAPPGEFLEVGGFSDDADQFTQADENGDWFVDFGAVGFDITRAMLKREQQGFIGDEDGDNTGTDFVYPWFAASLTDDDVVGTEFTPCSVVTVEVYDSPGGTLLASDTAPINARGNFELGAAELGQDLVPGMEVVATDGVVTKELTLRNLTIDFFSAEQQSSFGTADPGTLVLAGWSFTDPGPEGGGFGDGVQVVADGNGDWTADLGCCPPDGSEGGAEIEDGDGDVTHVRFVPADEAIPNLADDVNALVTGGQMTAKDAKPLLSKLNAALKQTDSNAGAAVNQLQAFINQVETYVKGGKLSAAAGQELIDAANAIITGLGG